MTKLEIVIIVKSGENELTAFYPSRSETGYILVDLIGQQFTLNFDPTNLEKLVDVDALLKNSK